MPIGNRFKIATIRGVPIYVATSWIWIAALYLYIQYVSLTNSAWEPAPGTALGLAFFGFVLFFGGILLHESAHAIAARGFGLPVSGITMVFWGGATETRANAKGPFVEFVVAMVGPATTLGIAGAFTILAGAMQPGLMREIVRGLASLNLLFAAINALPGFPLDGGRMLLAATWAATKNRRTALMVAGYAGLVIGLVTIGAAAVSLANGGGWWLFLGYLGFVLVGTGRSTPQRLAARDLLSQGTAADAMRPMPDQIPASVTLSEALEKWLRDYPDRTFPVVDAGRVVGTVSMNTARRVGSRDPLRPVRDGMAPLSQTPVVAPDDRLYDVVEWIAGRDTLVLREAALVGAIGPADIERWYRRHIGADEGEPLDQRPMPPRPDL